MCVLAVLALTGCSCMVPRHSQVLVAAVFLTSPWHPGERPGAPAERSAWGRCLCLSFRREERKEGNEQGLQMAAQAMSEGGTSSGAARAAVSMREGCWALQHGTGVRCGLSSPCPPAGSPRLGSGLGTPRGYSGRCADQRQCVCHNVTCG